MISVNNSSNNIRHETERLMLFARYLLSEENMFPPPESEIKNVDQLDERLREYVGYSLISEEIYLGEFSIHSLDEALTALDQPGSLYFSEWNLVYITGEELDMLFRKMPDGHETALSIKKLIYMALPDFDHHFFSRHHPFKALKALSIKRDQ